MPFEKMDVTAIVAEKRKEQAFDKEYRKVRQEYRLIEEVVAVRKKKNISQRELAQKAGVSQQAISRLELEKHIPKMDTFIKILDGLDLELTIVRR